MHKAVWEEGKMNGVSGFGSAFQMQKVWTMMLLTHILFACVTTLNSARSLRLRVRARRAGHHLLHHDPSIEEQRDGRQVAAAPVPNQAQVEQGHDVVLPRVPRHQVANVLVRKLC